MTTISSSPIRRRRSSHPPQLQALSPSTGAATSPRGSSPNSSVPSSAPRSVRCAKPRELRRSGARNARAETQNATCSNSETSHGHDQQDRKYRPQSPPVSEQSCDRHDGARRRWYGKPASVAIGRRTRRFRFGATAGDQRAPISCSTISASPDARSFKRSCGSPRERRPPGTRIRAKNSSTSSKVCWSISSTAGRR